MTQHTTTKRLAAIAFAIATMLTTGCATAEIPSNNAAGADLMKRSPCACIQVEHQPSGYRWLG